MFCVEGTVISDADWVYSRWAARTQQSLESPKGDPLETGTNATIHTPGLAVALYTTSQMDTQAFEVLMYEQTLRNCIISGRLQGYSRFPLEVVSRPHTIHH